MKLSRYYQNSAISVGEELDLSPENHRHAIQVLRLKINESLILFNGKGGEYQARLVSLDKRKSSVFIESFDAIDRESPLQITLALAMIKPDKMDFSIQKAVELGVSTIQPIYTQRSVIKIKSNRLDKKMQHWLGVIIAACEQSGRTAIPKIEQPLVLDKCLQEYSKTIGITMLPDSPSRFTELDNLDTNSGITLYIGPEGGFTDDEEQQMLQQSLKAVNFGCRILRAETAAIAGITACQLQWGDI